MPHKYLWRKTRHFVVHSILGLDDTPHRIAMGVAIGIFITWTPTIGLQMILVVSLATLLRANRLVGVPLVWISNPLTLVPIYGPSYYFGMKLLGGDYTWAGFLEAIEHGMQDQESWWGNVVHWWEALERVFWPLWTGSLIVGFVLAVLAYVATYYGVIGYRKQHPHLMRLGTAPAATEADEEPAPPGP